MKYSQAYYDYKDIPDGIYASRNPVTNKPEDIRITRITFMLVERRRASDGEWFEVEREKKFAILGGIKRAFGFGKGKP